MNAMLKTVCLVSTATMAMSQLASSSAKGCARYDGTLDGIIQIDDLLGLLSYYNVQCYEDGVSAPEMTEPGVSIDEECAIPPENCEYNPRRLEYHFEGAGGPGAAGGADTTMQGWEVVAQDAKCALINTHLVGNQMSGLSSWHDQSSGCHDESSNPHELLITRSPE